MHKICFTISSFHASTCFEHHVLIVRRSKLYYTASGIITPIGGRPVHGTATYTKSPRTSIHFRQRCTSFWNPSFKKLVFSFLNHFLTADFTSSTALHSVLLYSHQHTDHHKRLAFLCEFQLEELFPRLRIQ